MTGLVPPSPLRVAVTGAAGRMGRAACDAVEAAADLTLAARAGRGDDIATVLGSGVDVLVDLSVPAASPGIVGAAVAHGVHAVVGTSGWTAERVAAMADQLAAAPGVGVLIAPNFALGALLLERFAARASRWFESVEIIELHHPDKRDAPSGTAVRTAESVATARRSAGMGGGPDATEHGLAGARGAAVDGIAVHSVRLRGMLASQEVLLGGPGEVLTLRHDTLDRSAFMPGLLLAVRQVPARPGLTVGLENWLDV